MDIGQFTLSQCHSMAMLKLLLVVFLKFKEGFGQNYGPVNLDSVDPLSLSWNQIHWLVKDQIKEVEALKAEHDEIYNEITGWNDVL